ncbi:hypothetical protein [Streptomyces sp. MJP52]|uniref:hypothetical protein n=1 Tax=Streptomyces sp. MJP52 TaxID=2940555 RepID=UPI0024756E95|nr:hypothetical protein [Streptomyces sp. MJP52]MDH6226200.1 hypothetical protein [Streptomyces sp. MJP52]
MSALNPTARDLARVITRLESRVSELEAGARTGQLQHASLTGTAITVYDEDGTTRRGAIGIQPDGTLGLVAEAGPAPGAPTAPVVTPSLGGLSVVWDGALDDGSPLPADFDHVAVHVSGESGFTPDPTTFAGTITRSGEGGRLPVTPLPYQEHYVRLTAVTTSAVGSLPSAETAATPLRVDGPDLEAGSVTAGAIQAGAVTADKLEAVLQLVNRIVAGDPAGARVELNADGLRVYNGTGQLVVRFDSATGDAVFTGAITGSTVTGGQINGATINGVNITGSTTVTGATVQTATTGRRITMTPDGRISLYSGAPTETAPGSLASEVLSSGGSQWGYLSLTAPKHGSYTPPRISLLLNSEGLADYTLGPLNLTEGYPDGPRSSFDGDLSVLGKVRAMTDLEVWGKLTAGNIATGTVRITPSAAHTPTSAQVTFPAIAGTTVRGWATASTTVPGVRTPAGAAGVTGVSVSSVTSTSMLVWVNRENTTETVINWMVVGS